MKRIFGGAGGGGGAGSPHYQEWDRKAERRKGRAERSSIRWGVIPILHEAVAGGVHSGFLVTTATESVRCRFHDQQAEQVFGV